MCCLFWPPPNAQALDLPYTAEGWLQWWKRSTFARSLQLLLQVGLGSCRSQPTDAHRRRFWVLTTSPLPPAPSSAKGGAVYCEYTPLRGSFCCFPLQLFAMRQKGCTAKAGFQHVTTKVIGMTVCGQQNHAGVYLTV